MFTWICPQCGREVPPAYNDCPDCAKRAAAGDPAQAQAPPEGQQSATGAYPPQPPPPAGAYPPPPPPPPPPTYYQQPPQAAPPPPGHYPPQPPMPPGQQPYYQQPQVTFQPQQPPQGTPPGYYVVPGTEPRRRGLNLPVWLMTIIFAMAIGGVVFGILWAVSTNRGSAGNGPAPIASVENPAAKPGAKANPLQKYIEISGVRFVTDAKKKLMAKFVVVNHSGADIQGLAGNVTIWGRTQKSEEDAQGSFSFSVSLAPMESKELSVPLTTKKKPYEMADWQNVTTDVQITAPAGE